MAKIREVFPTGQVAHIWANQSQARARDKDGRLFFDGAAIYSYRASYAIAAFSPWRDSDGRRLVIMRETPYSATTRRHMDKAAAALSGHPVYIVSADPVQWTSREDAPRAREAARVHFNDYSRPEAARIEAGDPDTAAGIVGALVLYARGMAADALDKVGPARIAHQFERAAAYVADARIVADASAAALKGNARRAHVARMARILAEAPELPAGFVARAEALARAPGWPIWPGYQASEAERAAYERARAAQAAAVAAAESLIEGDAAELARALWRRQRDARKERRKAERLASRVERARACENRARNITADHAAAPDAARRDAWMQAAQEWRIAATVAAAIKRPAAERAKYRAAAEAAERRADRLADSAAVQSAHELVSLISRSRISLMRNMAKGARGKRERHTLATGARWRSADCMPSAWRETREPAHRLAVRADAVGNVARAALAAPDRMGSAAADAIAELVKRLGPSFAGREAAETARAVSAAASGRSRHAESARRLIAELARVSAAASSEARAAIRKIEGRHVAAEAIETARAIAPFLAPGAITAETAEAANRAFVLRRAEIAKLGQDSNGFIARIMRARGVESAAAVSTAQARAESILSASSSLARVYSAADRLNIAEGAFIRARDKLAAGMALEAEKIIQAAMGSLESAQAVATEAARQAQSAAEPAEMPDEVREAWRLVGDRSAELSARAAQTLAEAHKTADAVRAAADAARADIVAHWRATGEGLDYLRRTVGYSAAYFRRSPSGSIVSSLGAEVPEAAGRRLWALIRATVAAGQDRTWTYGAGPRVGYFRVERIGADGSAKVGCHTISAAEARAFARYMEWPPIEAAVTAEEEAMAEAAEAAS